MSRPIPGLLAALALVAAACAGDAGPAPEPPTETPEEEVEAPDGVLPEGPSALRDMHSPDLPEPLIDPAEIISGGPPPDGIPPLDDPSFVSVEEADEWLADPESVVVLELGGEARAYPTQILIWHEIVNDRVGGVPVSVTYCPLCNSAVSYVREVRGVETTFGTSGRLFASALVMYDRATESLWTHFDGRAVVGVLAGDQLEILASPLVAWQEFKQAHPDGEVLSRQTGFGRRYGTNPYTGYDQEGNFPFLFRGDLDERERAMRRVVGVSHQGETKAWTLASLGGEGPEVTPGTIGETPIVILWEPGQATALESEEVAGGRDVGTVGVFVPEVDGRTLTFVVEDGRFVDQETGSTWNVLGRAVAGPLEGQTMERLHHLDTFWFAWSTYQPDTDLISEEG